MKKNFKILVLLAYLPILTITTSSCQSNSSSEKKENMSEKLSFPKSTGFDVPFMKSNFWRLTYNSAGQDLAYWIVLPKVMKPTNVKPTPIESIGVILIGEYQVVDKNEPYLEVQVAYEKITSKHQDIKLWFSEKLRKLSGTLIEESPVKIADKDGYDVLFTRTLKSGEQYVSRASMFIAGENYVMVMAMVSKADYEKSAKTMYHILSNWGMQ